jgi:hypothetical protein
MKKKADDVCDLMESRFEEELAMPTPKSPTPTLEQRTKEAESKAKADGVILGKHDYVVYSENKRGYEIFGFGGIILMENPKKGVLYTRNAEEALANKRLKAKINSNPKMVKVGKELIALLSKECKHKRIQPSICIDCGALATEGGK